MRITNRYMTNNMVRNVQNNLSNLASIDEQMATSKRVLRLSDDPNIMGQLFSVKTHLKYNEQYAQNIKDGLGYMDTTDTTLGTLGDVLAQAKVYALQGANDPYNAEDRKALAQQIDKIIDQVVDLGNATVGGKYIFAGKKSSQPPFKREGDTIKYYGDNDEVRREVLAGTDYAINANGVTLDGSGNLGIFGAGTAQGDYYEVGEGVFEALFNLKEALQTDDANGLQDSIKELEDVRDGVLQHRVAVGARYQHFDTLKSHLVDQEVALTDSLKTLEGADYSKLSIELNQKWLSYSASMATGSKLMQTSLLDYIR